MSWKTCPIKFKQTLQETNFSCQHVCTPALPFKILRHKLKYIMNTRSYKLCEIQKFYFRDKQF